MKKQIPKKAKIIIKDSKHLIKNITLSDSLYNDFYAPDSPISGEFYKKLINNISSVESKTITMSPESAKDFKLSDDIIISIKDKRHKIGYESDNEFIELFPKPLKFTAIEANDTIELVKSGTPEDISLQYSLDDKTWNDYTIGDTITLANVGDYVKFIGNTDTFNNDTKNYYTFSSTADTKISGDIISLINYYNLSSYCFTNLFKNNIHIKDVSELNLSTTLAEGCYQGMFQGCTGLTDLSTFKLPATTLAEGCYRQMFQECTSLTKAPELPVTTLAEGCYRSMFAECTSLVETPVLPATTLATYCYSCMFYNCTSLAKAPELPSTSLANSCYDSMFYGCTNLNYIKVGATSWDTTYAPDWVSGVSSTGTFIKPSGTTIITGTSGIPSGWTVEDTELS